MSAATLIRLATPLDANWRLRGNCVTQPDDDPNLMYPDTNAAAEAKAKRKCNDCPVTTECFIDSINQRDFEGVRAEMTGQERRDWFDEHHPDGKWFRREQVAA